MLSPGVSLLVVIHVISSAVHRSQPGRGLELLSVIKRSPGWDSSNWDIPFNNLF